MQEMLKNIAYAGIGLAFLTKEKIEEIKNELLEKGRLSQEEGKRFAADLVSRSEKAKEELDQWVDKKVRERLDRLNLASKDEVAALRAAIEDLRKDIAEQKGQ